jgi:uncharacterized membrane protein YhaH (DUF805 family)
MFSVTAAVDVALLALAVVAVAVRPLHDARGALAVVVAVMTVTGLGSLELEPILRISFGRNLHKKT